MEEEPGSDQAIQDLLADVEGARQVLIPLVAVQLAEGLPLAEVGSLKLQSGNALPIDNGSHRSIAAASRAGRLHSPDEENGRDERGDDQPQCNTERLDVFSHGAKHNWPPVRHARLLKMILNRPTGPQQFFPLPKPHGENPLSLLSGYANHLTAFGA